MMCYSKCHLVLFSMPQRLINYLKHPNLGTNNYNNTKTNYFSPFKTRAHKHKPFTSTQNNHQNNEHFEKNTLFSPIPPFRNRYKHIKHQYLAITPYFLIVVLIFLILLQNQHANYRGSIKKNIQNRKTTPTFQNKLIKKNHYY